MVQAGLLPVFRTADVRHLFPGAKALYDAGIGGIEYRRATGTMSEG